MTILFLLCRVAFSQENVEVFNANLADVSILKDVDTNLKNDLTKRYSNTNEAKWFTSKVMNNSGHNTIFQLAYFKISDTVYTVVYSEAGDWLATESRTTKKGRIYVYKGEYPSFAIFPKSVKTHLSKGEDKLNLNKKESSYGAYNDAYKIVVNPKHDMALKYKENIFYVVNMDSVTTIAGKDNLINGLDPFYGFYDAYRNY